jgi:hypothetical protein
MPAAPRTAYVVGGACCCAMDRLDGAAGCIRAAERVNAAVVALSLSMQTEQGAGSAALQHPAQQSRMHIQLAERNSLPSTTRKLLVFRRSTWPTPARRNPVIVSCAAIRHQHLARAIYALISLQRRITSSAMMAINCPSSFAAIILLRSGKLTR